MAKFRQVCHFRQIRDYCRIRRFVTSFSRMLGRLEIAAKKSISVFLINLAD